jgi:hypothetical protein
VAVRLLRAHVMSGMRAHPERAPQAGPRQDSDSHCAHGGPRQQFIQYISDSAVGHQNFHAHRRPEEQRHQHYPEAINPSNTSYTAQPSDLYYGLPAYHDTAYHPKRGYEHRCYIRPAHHDDGYHYDRDYRYDSQMPPRKRRCAPPPPPRPFPAATRVAPRATSKGTTFSPYDNMDLALASPGTSPNRDCALHPSTLFALASKKPLRPDGNDASPTSAQSLDEWMAHSNVLLVANAAAHPRDTTSTYTTGAFGRAIQELHLAYKLAAAGARSREDSLRAVCCSDRFPEFCRYVNHINGYLLFKALPPPRKTAATSKEATDNVFHFDDDGDPGPAAEDEAAITARIVALRAARTAARDPPDLVRNPYTQEAVHASALAYNPETEAFMWPPKFWRIEQPPYIRPWDLRPPMRLTTKEEDETSAYYQELRTWETSGCEYNSHLATNPPPDSKWAGQPGLEIAAGSPNDFKASPSQRYHQFTVENMRYQGLPWNKRTRPFLPGKWTKRTQPSPPAPGRTKRRSTRRRAV